MHGTDEALDKITAGELAKNLKARPDGLEAKIHSNLKVASNATSTNPKDLIGVTKVSVTKVPPVAILHMSHAMMDGARKYGPFNWRAKDVVADIYIDAAMRHLMSWFEGEETAQDSGVHHLGHAMACCAILLDAEENSNLIDNRPVTAASRGVATRVLDRLSGVIKAKAQQRAVEEQKAASIAAVAPSPVIYINGSAFACDKEALAYEDVCLFVGIDPVNSPTVTWQRPEGGCGVLSLNGTRVKVTPSLRLDCYVTGNA